MCEVGDIVSYVPDKVDPFYQQNIKMQVTSITDDRTGVTSYDYRPVVPEEHYPIAAIVTQVYGDETVDLFVITPRFSSHVAKVHSKDHSFTDDEGNTQSHYVENPSGDSGNPVRSVDSGKGNKQPDDKTGSRDHHGPGTSLEDKEKKE